MQSPQQTSTSALVKEKPFVEEGLKSSRRTVKTVDLFAGIGGFHYGIAAAAARRNKSVKPILVSEIEPSCQITYANNHSSEVLGDINEIDLGAFNDIADIVTAGFPCQPFSNSGKKMGLTDPRGQFYFRIEEIIKHFGAKAFILENVPGIRKNGGGNFPSRLAAQPQTIGSTMHELEKNLLKLTDYEIKWFELDSSKLGSPQVRKRVYIIGIHKDFMRGNGFELSLNNYAPNNFIKIADRNAPESLNLSPSQEKNLRSFMNSAPSYKDGMRRVGKAYLCEGGNVGQGYHAFGMVPTLTKVWARFLPIYFPSNLEAKPRINVREFEPDQNYGLGHFRRASIREVMRLQGFPDSFVPHEQHRIAYEHAGNAVNAKTIREITENIFRYIG